MFKGRSDNPSINRAIIKTDKLKTTIFKTIISKTANNKEMMDLMLTDMGLQMKVRICQFYNFIYHFYRQLNRRKIIRLRKCSFKVHPILGKWCQVRWKLTFSFISHQ